MQSFEGIRAVVTGGASGIGLGLATSLLEQGAAGVALLDIEAPALDRAVRSLSDHGGEVVGVRCDVTDAASVDEAASQSWERLGGVQVVCLNAGVFCGGHAWEATVEDWAWVMGVNLGGVVNGIRSFVPRLIEAGGQGHVMITASIAGVVAAPVSAPYVTSKFAAVGLAESLHHDLQIVGADHVGVSVVCPGMVSTNIGDGARNRPVELPVGPPTEGAAMAEAGIADSMPRGLDPLEGARNVLEQVRAGRFYVSTHPVELWERLVRNENDDRLAGRAPQFQMYE
jgi:NAD(P)-dependent dehydrogenase (short-subunit alcohol dehydrogenase family)